ncbi:MAG TPA: hypothetical protein VL326_21925 [Kofleriaceae bacterium]|nr:hypothetical protein [Kofleriaceae bacterium]
MRSLSALRAVLLVVAVSATGCATRARPYRFSSPLLGMADVPPAPLPGSETKSHATRVAGRSSPPRRAGGWQADTQGGAIRVVSAAGIELKKPVASAEAADAIVAEPNAQPSSWESLPAPNKTPSITETIVSAIPPPPKEPSDLRSLVGDRDKRDPFLIVQTWAIELGLHIDGTDGPSLVTWAAAADKLAARDAVPNPGDVLVFDRAVSGNESDLVALVIGRDARGVTEFLYAGGGVIRRGFCDPSRASIRRDENGVVVNTFLRHGKLWPPKGTRYLAGELLSHVIRSR